jgi:hypothetical protein
MQRDGNLWCETGFAETPATYKGATQTARVLTEGWLAMWGFCPACGADRLPALPNNSPVADFRCAACGEEYELKATRAPLGRKVPDGAFGTMTARLAAANNPSLFVMRYDRTAARVADLIVVPRHFFTPAIIEHRRPLGPRGSPHRLASLQHPDRRGAGRRADRPRSRRGARTEGRGMRRVARHRLRRRGRRERARLAACGHAGGGGGRSLHRFAVPLPHEGGGDGRVHP